MWTWRRSFTISSASLRLSLLALPLLVAPACMGVIGDDVGVEGGGSGATSTQNGAGGAGATGPGPSTGVGPGAGTGAGTGGMGGTGMGGAGQATSSSAQSSSESASVASSSSAVASSSSGGGTEAQMICARWKADRAVMDEGTWSGSVTSCNAGDISADGRANALKIVNLYRFLAGLPEVTFDAAKNQRAQECALMMHANNTLSHSPPTTWKCYTAEGAQGAGTSNISSGRGVTSVDMYMSDFGNATTIGHRRWILSNSLGPIGLGTTSQYSCMLVIGGSGNAGKAYQPWPPAGIVPVQALLQYQSVDQTGWTIQSDSIDLSKAQVSVKDGGADKPVTVTTLGNGYGSSQAIRMVPNGWTTQAGHTYDVSVSGASQAISYSVEVIDCP